MGKGAKYYCQDSTVTFSEDQEHEFKGHLCVSKDQVDPSCVTNHTVNRNRPRPTRAPASRSICGFLNTGLGGTIYFGILDNGVVVGHPLTENRKKHFLMSLKDTLSRFTPAVAQHRVCVSFVPVLTREELEFQEKHRLKIDVREDMNLSHTQRFTRPAHRVRTYKRCWCVFESLDEFSAGIRAQRYVVEVRIKKWNPHDKHYASVEIGPSVFRHQFHTNEEGRYYYRGFGSVRALSHLELRELTNLHDQMQLQQALTRRYEQLERRKAFLRPRKPTRHSESDQSFASSDTSNRNN